MDTIDRSHSNLPSPIPVGSPQAPARLTVVSNHPATISTPSFNPRTLWRGLARHWWKLLLVWSVLAVTGVYLIQRLIPPTFEAFSILKIEPVHDLYGQNRAEDFRSVQTYVQTQVALVTTDRVLSDAVARPAISNMSIVRAEDSIGELRKNMVVETLKDATLMRIALELGDPKEAAEIVNAVVDSYLEYYGGAKRDASKVLQASLNARQKVIENEIAKKRTELGEFYSKGTVDAPKAKLNDKLTKKNGDSEPTFSSVSAAQIERLADEMIRTDLEFFKTESDLAARDSANREDEQDQGQESKLSDEQKEQWISEEFVRDPEIVALSEEIVMAAEQRDRAKSLVRQGNDPARRAADQKHKKLMAQYEEQWKIKHAEIAKRLKSANHVSGSPESINDLRVKLQSLKVQKKEQAKLFAQLKVDTKKANNDTFEAAFVNHQLDSLLRSSDHLKTNLEELEFRAEQETYRVSKVDPAKPPKFPTNNKRTRYMIAAPLALLFMVLGLFFLLEVKSERVADPDTLSTRVGSEVFALPPLPTARAVRKLVAPGAHDPIEQFKQRLDHIRFAVCGNSSELGIGRCLLVTSAIGGEGKTTLAAQLAMRCGQAGMNTLLIDADLHRTGLCRLLDVPEGLGLSDMLQEEYATEDVVIPVQDGAFHLLRAGTPLQDTGRLFQSDRLGLLITRLRQNYDLIIIDSPPVLPVPDALILGRWTDGAILAARYDKSRFPQLDRARRQLDSAGIAIMGTVINGMRNADSYYGRYSYSRRPSPQSSSSDAI
jgi:polysaccharide biosynthesis transport protein